MRTNLPVTQQEHLFAGTETLLSTTDTSSNITYANAAFMRTSGYSMNELLWQPHNLVRHPDMPQEAFADMWQTLKSGRAWTALVKNRRQNGDHYWVRANAAPMCRNSVVTGYLSVRTKPQRAEIDAAANLYQRFKEGKAAGLAFHQGLIVRTGLMRWLSALQLMPSAWRVRLPLLVLGIAMGLILPSAGLTGVALASVYASLTIGLMLTGWFIEAQITSPLKQVREVAQQVATGQAGAELNLNRCDDIGVISRSINQAGLNINSLIADVLDQASSVQSASSEIAAATNDLSSRSEQTASSLEQTAAAMEQQTASVRHNSETAQRASELVQAATVVVAQGGRAMTEVVTTMANISNASKKIADIIGVIDGIAFQTNILALNAAVEAARAGEQGRGFAVVASEVRSLAGRSAGAAKEIKTLIDESVRTVDSGSKLVTDAGITMAEVVKQVGQVNDLIAEITVASREQSQGIAQVGQSIAHIDTMTQQNAAMVEENGAAATSLGDQAQRLVEAVKVFSI
jgi:aerotaxis receptor